MSLNRWYYITKIRKGKHKEEGTMKKSELARIQAEHMNSVNSEVNIERMTKVLVKGMTTEELKKAINNWNK